MSFSHENLDKKSLLSHTINLFTKEMLLNTMTKFHIKNQCLLILDHLGSKLISTYVSMSETITLGLYSVESLYKVRKPLTDFDAIYLISNSKTSVNLAKNDMRKKRYRSCHLFVVGEIDGELIDLMVDKRFLERLKSIKQITVNYSLLDQNFYCFGDSGNFSPLSFILNKKDSEKMLMINLSV